MNKQSRSLNPCVAIAPLFYYNFVIVFTGNNSTPLQYTPDLERENRIEKLYSAIEKKIGFFTLPQAEVKELITHAQTIENACIIGFETESLSVENPEDIYNFSIAIESNYSAEVEHLKTWRMKVGGDYRLQKTKELLGIVEGLDSTFRNEISANHHAHVKAAFKYLQADAQGNVFTKSWMLRVMLQLLQPYKSYTFTFPALAQTMYLESQQKTLGGIIGYNLEALIAKKEYVEQLALFQELTPDELSQTDLTPLLPLGYDIIEQSLKRADYSLRKLYRQKVDYEKKDPRIRNLINFLYMKGVEYLEPIMEGLNERQLKIIKFLFEKRYLGTKELSLSFRCDRKTIQRDFAKLLNCEIVRSSGNGSALKYSINLKNNGYDLLEIYSTAVRRREDFQESLFGEEIWETVKKA